MNKIELSDQDFQRLLCALNVAEAVYAKRKQSAEREDLSEIAVEYSALSWDMRNLRTRLATETPAGAVGVFLA